VRRAVVSDDPASDVNPGPPAGAPWAGRSRVLVDIGRRIGMKVYLVGFMGAGKTTIGSLLARRLDVPFFDLDALVEQAEAMTIKEIFATCGEPHFRKRERDILQSTRHVERAVIATGGGTFTFEENIQFMRTGGVSVYLSAQFPLLVSRVGERAAERPLFRDDLAMHQLYQSRLKFYRMSDLTIEIREGEEPEEIVERIVLDLPNEFRRPGSARR